MKKIIVFALLMIAASTHSISASDGDQLPESTIEGQTISSQLSSPSTDLSDTLLPAPSDHQANDSTKPQEDLSHEGITSAPQSKAFLQLFDIVNLFKANKATQPIQPAIKTSELAARKEPGTTSLPDSARKNNYVETPQAVPDELTHQVLSSEIQGKGTFSFSKPDDTMPLQISAPAPNQGTGAVGPTSTSSTDGRKADLKNSSQIDPDDISHQSLVTEVQGRDIMSIFSYGDSAENLTISNQPSSIKGTTTPDDTPKNSQTLVPQSSGAENLPHQSFIAAIQVKERSSISKSFGQFLSWIKLVPSGIRRMFL